MKYALVQSGPSRSFPDDDAFVRNQSSVDSAQVILYSGARWRPDAGKVAILVELQHECLADHVNEGDTANRNVLGFARYRNGDDPPSRLVELVCRSNSSEVAVAAARRVFETAGFEVAVCTDHIGRIVSRLVVPKYNAALRLLDEGLASQADMDLTCRLGLGYPDGPIERVTRGGLANHYTVSKALFEAYGTTAYAPPRRAIVAFRRVPTKEEKTP